MPGLQPKAERNSSDHPEEFRATLAEHLEELRQRLFRVVALLAVGFTVGWMIEPWVYEKLATLVRENVPRDVEFKEVFATVVEPFFLKLKLSFYIGLVLTLPFTVLQLWGFVAPGLKPAEKAPLQMLAPFSVMLFVLGCAVCWLILPATFQWFIGYVNDFPGVAVYQAPSQMVFFIVKMMLAFGIGFELPIVVFVLTRLGIITPEALLKYWRQCIVGIALASAMLTPSGDIFSMSMLAMPLTLLFFGSVAVARMTTGSKGRPEALDNLD